MFLISAFYSYFIFLNFQAHFLLTKSTLASRLLFLTSKNSCKEYFVEQKQMKSTTTACSKLWMLGSKTCHVCTQSCSGLDAINSTFENFEQWPSSVRILHHHYCIQGSQEQECMNPLLAPWIGTITISSFTFQLNLVQFFKQTIKCSLRKFLFFKTRTPTPQYGVVDIIAVICRFSHNVIKIQTRE